MFLATQYMLTLKSEQRKILARSFFMASAIRRGDPHTCLRCFNILVHAYPEFQFL
jgi:hypothetical protein